MKTHRLDPVSFISGLVIALLGLAFLIPQTPVDVIDVVTNLGGWFWPVVLVVIGVAVLLPVFLPKEKTEDAKEVEPAAFEETTP
jgi:hypothetical protein